jgi:glycerol uptake facilitator-like aquaporin
VTGEAATAAASARPRRLARPLVRAAAIELVATGFLLITGAYWFTASTSFANPAVTIARALTDSFAGIRPDDVPGFVLAQFTALALALPLLRRRG